MAKLAKSGSLVAVSSGREHRCAATVGSRLLRSTVAVLGLRGGQCRCGGRWCGRNSNAGELGVQIATLRRSGIRSQGGRAPIVNYVGCAIGGAHHETVNCAIDALGQFSGSPQAGVFGLAERF